MADPDSAFGVNIYAIQGILDIQPAEHESFLQELEPVMRANFGPDLNEEKGTGVWLYANDMTPGEFLSKLGEIGEKNGVTFRVEVNHDNTIYYTFCGEDFLQQPLGLNLAVNPRTHNYIMIEKFLQGQGIQLKEVFPELQALDEKIISLLSQTKSRKKFQGKPSAWEQMSLGTRAPPSAALQPQVASCATDTLPISKVYKTVLPVERKSSPQPVRAEDFSEVLSSAPAIRGRAVKTQAKPPSIPSGVPLAKVPTESPVATDPKIHLAPKTSAVPAKTSAVPAKPSPTRLSPAKASPAKASPGNDSLEKMTIAQLKAELDTMGVAYKSKSLKSDLIKMVLEARGKSQP